MLFIFLLLRTFGGPVKKAFWAASASMAAASLLVEYFFMKYDVWFFSEKVDRLLGLWIGRAPVEEFVYWFGATPFCLAVYLCYTRLLKKNA